MSVLDDLKKLEDHVTARARELRPLLDEYAELERAAQRLGIDLGADAGQSSGAANKTPRERGPGRPRKTAQAKRKTSRATSAEATATATAADENSGKPARGHTSSSAAKRTSKRKPGTRGGDRAQQVAELVKQRPGITIKELGTELGVDPTSLYRVVKRLQDEDNIVKQGRELQPK